MDSKPVYFLMHSLIIFISDVLLWNSFSMKQHITTWLVTRNIYIYFFLVSSISSCCYINPLSVSWVAGYQVVRMFIHHRVQSPIRSWFLFIQEEIKNPCLYTVCQLLWQCGLNSSAKNYPPCNTRWCNSVMVFFLKYGHILLLSLSNPSFYYHKFTLKYGW